MRLWLALCVMTSVALPTSGAKVLTVEQLQKLLDNARHSHRNESDLVRQNYFDSLKTAMQ